VRRLENRLICQGMGRGELKGKLTKGEKPKPISGKRGKTSRPRGEKRTRLAKRHPIIADRGKRKVKKMPEGSGKKKKRTEHFPRGVR